LQDDAWKVVQDLAYNLARDTYIHQVTQAPCP
jgi:hypothetical protein